MLSINSISFSGKLVRQTYYKRCQDSPKKSIILETTGDEFVGSYDAAIKEIQDRKSFAIQLDDMMHNDPEITELIAELPDEMEIEVAGNFQLSESEGSDLDIDCPTLIACHKQFRNDIFMEVPYSEEGPNKEQIVAWLNNLKTYFK